MLKNGNHYKVTHFVRIAQIFNKDTRIMIYNVYYYMKQHIYWMLKNGNQYIFETEKTVISIPVFK